MKKPTIATLLAAGLLISANASAFWNNNNYNECWGNPYDCNPYDPWDPRYWFEEMEGFFDDNDNYGYPMPYGYAPGYQVAPGQMPYQQMPYMPPRPPHYGPYAAPRPGMPPAPVAPPIAPRQPVAPSQPSAPKPQQPATPEKVPAAKAPAIPGPAQAK